MSININLYKELEIIACQKNMTVDELFTEVIKNEIQSNN